MISVFILVLSKILLLIFIGVGPQDVNLNVADITEYDALFSKSSRRIYVSHEIDLEGQTLSIPDNCELVFRKGGRISNGCIVGNNTRIKGSSKLFDHVSFKGTWIVPVISTEMFVDLDYVNSLQEVFALSDSSVKNTIKILEGDYFVSTNKEKIDALRLKSNTDLIIDGTIRLIPNTLQRSYILLVDKCSNVSISGNGTLIGDREEHLGNDGEWGMGIYISDSEEVTVNNISVYNCWGDCICVCKNSKTVQIKGCNLERGRRQGISIIDVCEITISDCFIANIGGTNPGYAIDIEPDSKCSVSNVSIKNVQIKDCSGGILVYAKAKASSVKEIRIQNCTITASEQYPLRCEGGSSIMVTGCQIDSDKVPYCIWVEDSMQFILDGNTIHSTKRVFRKISHASIHNNIIFCENLFSAFSELHQELTITNNIIVGNVNADFENSTIKNNKITSTRKPIIKNVSNNIVIENNIFEQCSSTDDRFKM